MHETFGVAQPPEPNKNQLTFHQFFTLILLFAFFVGADCTAIWIMQ